ncbi:DNA-binding protein [Geomonas sp.]|uniref:DNA-binding protein n=1 Tax=Geomonas sp. TaxID=2651584 RepID=UPI002B481365|nr:DNA-binding protein [Geomonas sp.]HJV35858.1 DNA-binding protein [Geomonas sp.]
MDAYTTFPQGAVPEFITVEQLADRLQVSRATLFTWKQTTELIQGRHYFKRGRVLRFVWSAELAQILLGGSATDDGKPSPVRSVKPASKQAKSNPVNWEY